MPDIKSKLKYLIEQETDETVLKAIKTILGKSHLDLTLKEKLTRKALTAEDDIKSERTFTKKQIT